MNRAAFLDRDGVINRKARAGEYVTRWQDVKILPGVAEAIALLNRADFRTIVISNQRCVAKGLISEADLKAMHQQLNDILGESGARLDAIYYCPHEEEPACSCRKPAPGMLLTAAHDHGIDLGSSWMIGDSSVDVQAGVNAGCKTVRIVSGDKADGPADFNATSLLGAVQLILRQEQTVISAF